MHHLTSRVVCPLLLTASAALYTGCGADSPAVSAGTTTEAKQADGQVTLVGRVTPGWALPGRVSVYELQPDGTRLPAGSAAIDADGAFTIVPRAGTTMLAVFEADSQPALRAAFDASSPRVTISPFSEAAVRSIESSPQPDWRAGSVDAANDRIAATIGVADLIGYAPKEPAGANLGHDARMTLFGRAAAAFVQRLDPPPGSDGRAFALDRLYRMLVIDPYDDRIMPAYVAGLAAALDASVGDADGKRALLGGLLLLEPAASDGRLAAALPRGTPTGQASAPMTDDGYALIGSFGPLPLHSPGTMFNERGALVAFQSNAGRSTYRGLHTASVGEVFGDGEIGIGRWHGGAIASYLRDAHTLSHPADAGLIDVDGGLHYAVIRNPEAVPACGQRRLPRTAVTQATGGSTADERISLADESMVAIQYAGSAMHVGLDLAFHASRSRSLRAKTAGSVRVPWAGGIVAGPDGSFEAELPLVDGTRTVGRVVVSGRIGGHSARKVVMHLLADTGVAPSVEQVAAFAGSPGAVDPRGCVGDSSSLGSGLKLRSRARADRGLVVTAAGGRYELFL